MKLGKNPKNLIRAIGICVGTITGIKLFHNEILLAANKGPVDILLSVHMMARHGARTPMSLIHDFEEATYKHSMTEPYVKAKYTLLTTFGEPMCDKLSVKDQRNIDMKLKGGAGRGQLTKKGEKQGFELGLRAKQRYINELKFLSSEYTPNEIYIRSSHYRRTILTAKSFLAGLYNKSRTHIQNEPFIIHVHQLLGDFLVRNSLDCPHIIEMNKCIRKLDLYKKNKDYINNLKDMNKAFGSTETRITFQAFWDDISARLIHDLYVPKFAETIFNKKGDKYATMELSAASRHNLKLSCGRLFKVLKDNIMHTVINDSMNKSTEFQKFRYFSTHDSILNAVLSALDLTTNDHRKWPSFTADVTIELWKKVWSEESLTRDEISHYYVKLFYNGQPVLPKNVQPENTDEIDLNEFIKVLEKYELNQAEYQNLCAKSFSAHSHSM